jgi:hypothetical protein
LTHAKYAPAMFSMSLKSVPGCLVLIAPMLIGVPVAATPGLVPQDEVETVPADEEPAAAGDEALLDAGALVAVEADVVEEPELQPARTPSATAATTAAAVRVRPLKGLFMSSAFY